MPAGRYAACEAQSGIIAQRMYKGTTTALGKYKKLGRRLDELLRALRLARETVRLACQKLLRHGNLLLDGEGEVKLQLARLRELSDLEQDGCAVEVTSRWGTQALQLCREALVTLATRLELQVRLSPPPPYT